MKGIFAAALCSACFAGEAGVAMADTKDTSTSSGGTLSAAAPQLELDGPQLARPPGVVTLQVERNDNPGGLAFSIALSVRAGDGAWMDVGSVTPYPAGHTGTFLMEIADAPAAALARGARLRLSLVPVNAPLAGPLTVSIPKLTWSKR